MFIILTFFSILKNSEEISRIACFDPIENSWKRMGKLKVARGEHGVIQIENKFIVVGGRRKGEKDEPTELCKLNGIAQLMKCTTTEPQLSEFTSYPELMLFS